MSSEAWYKVAIEIEPVVVVDKRKVLTKSSAVALSRPLVQLSQHVKGAQPTITSVSRQRLWKGDRHRSKTLTRKTNPLALSTADTDYEFIPNLGFQCRRKAQRPDDLISYIFSGLGLAQGT